MRLTLHGFGMLASASVLAMVCSCGGGGSNSPTQNTSTNHPPLAAIPVWTPADKTLSQFTTYTFTTVGTDPDLGNTVASYEWDFGDATPHQTTTVPTVSYAYGTTGAFKVQVRATDNLGLTGAYAGASINVATAVNPFTLTVIAPSAASTQQVQAGNNVNITFSVKVASTGAGTISPSGIILDPNDPTATVGTAVDGGGGVWNIPVTYPAAAATGSRTVTPTFQVQDSLGLRSAPPLALPALTIKTVSGVNSAPVITMAATPSIVAGTNATWQNVPIQFAATASDPDGDALSYSWTFGDGGKGDVAGSADAGALNQTHTFAVGGVYPVTFTADDGRTGGKKAITLSMNILANAAPALVVVQTPAGDPFAGVPVTFAATVTDPNADVSTLSWDFGDSSTDKGATVTHTFLAAGTTTVTLKADDAKGGISTWTTTFTVQPNHAPVAAITTPVASLYEGKSYTFTASASDPDAADTIVQYLWDFGDGTPVQTSTTNTQTHAFASTFAGTASVKVRSVDNHGAVGDFSPAMAFTVLATPLPAVTFLSPAATTLNVDMGGHVSQTFVLSITNPRAGTAGVVDPIPVGNITFLPNDPGATITSAVSNGGGTYTFIVQYPGAAAVGTRVAVPTVYALDSLAIQSLTATGPAQTIQTMATNHAPTITITAPTAASTAVFTSSKQTLAFTLTDADGDAVAYTIDWQDGTPVVPVPVSGATQAGVPVTVVHQFPDTFAGTAAVTINATDNRSTNAAAAPKTVSYVVTFNAYPTATITSPQASATTPASVAALSIPATDPAVVILPLNGKVAFQGVATLPGSQEGDLTYNWSFVGGAPSSSNKLSPGEVVFAGTPNQVTKYLVEFTVTDTFGRLSKNDPTILAGSGQQAFQRTFRRWVVVDGTNSQNLTLSFLYRQRSGTAAPDTYAYAKNPEHGFEAMVGIFQDGMHNTYSVSNGTSATTQIPIRSDVPFWLNVPSSITGDAKDGSAYMFSIPNVPNLDKDLEASKPPRQLTLGEGTAFAFQSATYPWNPQLQIATGGGFGTELVAAGQRRFSGNTKLLNNVCSYTGTNVYEPNLRWLDRLSVPTTDALPVLQFTQSANNVTGFSGLRGYQSIPEWFVFLKSMETRDWNTQVASGNVSGFTTASAPTDLGFVIDDKYLADAVSSQHYAVSAMQALRAPASPSDPYDFDVMNANLTVPGSTAMLDGNMNASVGLNPTAMGPSATTFLANLVNTSPTGPLTGGVMQVSVPYDANTTDRVPNNPQTYDAFHNRASFAYAEYLWTKVWARPLVVNRTNLNWWDTMTFPAYPTAISAPVECGAGNQNVDLPWFFFSNPTNRWPYAANVSPTASAYDLKVTNGGTFDASSPVSEFGSTGTTTGVGRFFWTAFAPQYNANPGALISRTWLADGVLNPNQIPTSFSAAADDATTAWGFIPPQDTVVDKRDRNLDGTPKVPEVLGGYRVTWFNSTRDSNGNVVAPDFWAVQLVNGSSTQVFLLSANYPRAAQSQTMNSPLVTDAREFLPSHQATYQSGDLAGTGACWFDIPAELRPASGSSTITVFALKSILKNHAVAGARILNRSEWVEAVKTATASISTKPGGQDVSFAHKIAFNYPWDIVVVNGPATPVAP